MKYLFLLFISFNCFAICESASTQAIAFRHCKCEYVIEWVINEKSNLSNANQSIIQTAMADINMTLHNCNIPLAISKINAIVPDGVLIKQSDINSVLGFLQ